MALPRAMNGLRVASKAWLGTCSQILRDNAGLITCPSEQTILAGVTNPSGVPTAVLVYVDDLLVGALSPRGIDDVRSALSASLKVKTTGSITSSRGVGGKLMFLGREVIRPQHSSSMLVRVPPSYLEDLFTNEPFCSDLKDSKHHQFRLICWPSLRKVIAIRPPSQFCQKRLQAVTRR